MYAIVATVRRRKKKKKFVFSRISLSFDCCICIYQLFLSFFFCVLLVLSTRTGTVYSVYSPDCFLLQTARNVLEKFHTSFVWETDITKGKQRSISFSLFPDVFKWALRMRVPKRCIVLQTEKSKCTLLVLLHSNMPLMVMSTFAMQSLSKCTTHTHFAVLDREHSFLRVLFSSLFFWFTTE